ncbi:hypothetical protein Tco_0899037, partial [Tanacetum coccineum]
MSSHRIFECPNQNKECANHFPFLKGLDGVVNLECSEARFCSNMDERAMWIEVPLPEDPYEAIRQDYLDGTNIESKPFEDLIDTKTPELPLTIAPPISLTESLSASIAEVAAMSESAFRKRFRSSYESSPSVSPPDLPSRKHYRGTSKLVEDSEEDEEIGESLDSDSVGEDTKYEGSTAEDDDPAARDEGLAAWVEGPGMDDESCGLDDESHGMDDEGRGLDDESHSVESDGLGLEQEEEAIPGGQQQAALVVGTAMSAPLGLGTFEVGQGSGSALEFKRPERVSASRQPTLTTWTDPEDGMVYIDVPAYPPPAPPIQTPPSPDRDAGGMIRDHAVRLEELSPALFKRYDMDIGELFTRSGAVKDEIFSQRYRFRSLEYEQERVAGENRDLRLQLAEEKHTRLELAEVVDSMKRGQEPRG